MNQTTLIITIIIIALLIIAIIWLWLRSQYQAQTSRLIERSESQVEYISQLEQKLTAQTNAFDTLSHNYHSLQNQHTALNSQAQVLSEKASLVPQLEHEIEEQRQTLEHYRTQQARQSQDITHFKAQIEQQQHSQQQSQSQYQVLSQQHQNSQEKLAQSQSQAAALQKENDHLKESLEEQHAAYENQTQSYQSLQNQFHNLKIEHERLHTQQKEAERTHAEKIQLLSQAKEALSQQFQNLANNILEEKTRRFTEQNHNHLNQLLHPLNEKIQGFSQLIQNTYEKESKERTTLENELRNLQKLNHQLHSDANALTQALTGSQNKTQGNWGEMILEKVLENSGLQKDREYFTQESGSYTDSDGNTRRLQPDVLIHLPDNKTIIIDAKVSLTAYVRHTQAQSPEESLSHLKAHIESIRSHINTLSRKEYSNISGLNSLDFIFMFIPVEPAYLLALQHEPDLLQLCFDKRIMLVGPSTLLASLRTVANIWRHEYQNQNAIAIAEEGGKLFDKFTGFTETLEQLGSRLQQAQAAYDNASKQLTSGRGNLINRAQNLQRLGAKTNKSLSKQWLSRAGIGQDEEEEEHLE